jgi:cysteinyl-tRNA synthetase
VETLIQKEYAYETPDGIYFDTLRFPRYGVLGDIPLEKLQAGARVSENTHKRNPTDFALWKKNDTTGWESPWGKGFPGWHIECSAMAMEYLGKELDIHTGGKDLIGTHHNNEIAQSECATGKKFVRYWLHNEYVHVAHTKISKSLGNSITLSHIVHAGYSPLDYRYWILTAHYRSPVDFTFPALDAVRTARERLERVFVEQCLSVPTGKKDPVYAERLLLAINDDLDTPKTIALLWEVARDATLSPEDKRATLLHIDSVLGIGLTQIAQRNKAPRSLSPMHMDDTGIPKEILDILAKREEARKKKDWKEADALRDTLIQKGYEVTDTPEGMRVQRHN